MARRDTLVGSLTILVATIAVFVAYNANEGLPFVPTYDVSVEVPDAAQLVKGDDVRIGGARVGQVQEVTAVERGGGPPVARLKLALNPALKPLPADSRAQVRPVSILGGKYLALEEGRSRRGIGTGGTLGVARARPTVDLDEALQIFDAETRRGLGTATSGLGEAVAGRGAGLNRTVQSARSLLPPLERVLRTVVARDTNLRGFLRAAATTTGALAPVAEPLGGLVAEGATTLEALDAPGEPLGRAIEELPATEATGTATLRRLTPVLVDAAALARELRPSASRLPGTSRRLERSLVSGTAALRARPRGKLDPLVRAFTDLAEDPASSGAVRKTQESFADLEPTLGKITAAQVYCNVFGIWAHNLASIASDGDAAGSWITLLPINRVQQMTQKSAPDPELHLNFYPREDATACEAGHETYRPGQQIGSPRP